MKVYLDNSATTAMAAEVIEAMSPYFSDEMGNAQSVHSFGQRAKAALEKARREVAALINASPAEIVFVSGGTEADNLAVRGIAEAHRDYGRHIITTKIEHPAVLATCVSLEGAGSDDVVDRIFQRAKKSNTILRDDEIMAIVREASSVRDQVYGD